MKLLERFKTRRESEAKSARRQYLELLGRRHSPRKSDADDLADIVRVLGLSDEEVETDCAVLDELDRLRSSMRGIETLEADRATAYQAKKAKEDEVAAIRSRLGMELAEIKAEFQRVDERLRDAQVARSNFLRLGRDRPDLAPDAAKMAEEIDAQKQADEAQREADATEESELRGAIKTALLAAEVRAFLRSRGQKFALSSVSAFNNPARLSADQYRRLIDDTPDAELAPAADELKIGPRFTPTSLLSEEERDAVGARVRREFETRRGSGSTSRSVQVAGTREAAS